MKSFQYSNIRIWQYNNKKGITLIEMVTVIVVLGLAIPPLLTMWAEVALKSGRSEAIADATFYAQQLMEEIKSKRFDERNTASWSPNPPAVFGPESGESYPNFDDVDDFNGYSENPISGIPGYNRCVTVDYVELSGDTWGGTCTPSNLTDCTPPNCTAANVTDYKRIIVRVSRTDNLVSDVTLVTIVSGY